MKRKRETVPNYVDPPFLDLYQKYREFTMVSWWRLYNGYLAAKYVAQNEIPGDLVECGVYKGGCCLLMAEAFALYGDISTRKIWMYDTFTGMTEPSERDTVKKGGVTVSAANKFERKKREDHVDWCYGPLDGVNVLIAKSTLPEGTVECVVGDVLETIPRNIPDKICLLRLDTDWYESTKHELLHLFHLVSPKGIVIIDDYGAWDGARQATDEFLQGLDRQPLLFCDRGGALNAHLA